MTRLRSRVTRGSKVDAVITMYREALSPDVYDEPLLTRRRKATTQNVERKAAFTGEAMGLSENGERKIIEGVEKEEEGVSQLWSVSNPLKNNS